MSIYFSVGDGRDVWNPSSEVARVFLAQTEVMAHYLAMDSGLGPVVSDEVIIDTMRFAAFTSAFTQRMLEYADDSCFHALMSGCFSIVLGLRNQLHMSTPTNDPRIVQYARAGDTLVGSQHRSSCP